MSVPRFQRLFNVSAIEIFAVLSGADLGFFVPQSKFLGRRGVIGAGRGLDWAWSTAGGEGGGEWALNDFYADSPPLDF